MADIKQAAKWLAEGKRVVSYKESTVPVFEEDGELFYENRNGKVRPFEMTFYCLLADDWEIAE